MKLCAKKRLCVVTSTRADWGLLSPLCRALKCCDSVELLVVATNMHLIDRFGYTCSEIESDGFKIACKVNTDVGDDSDVSRAQVMSLTLSGMAKAFDKLKPDAVLLLGDRYEILAAASAAAIMHLPIIHIAGGEITVGAIDDSFRHAITKLSALHLTATDDYRRRVIQLGENPDKVINTGAIGVWNAFNTDLMGAAELSESIGFDVSAKPLAIVTYHPVTNDNGDPLVKLGQFLDALDRFPGLRMVITAPNNDAGGARIFDALEEFVAARVDRAILVKSLGMRRYQSILRFASLVIGNSSSGIVEVPSAGIPTVDVGSRQKGRLSGPSVIHCADDTDSVAAAIAEALSPRMVALAAQRINPYYKPDTLDIMLKAILDFIDSLPLDPKEFYDLK